MIAYNHYIKFIPELENGKKVEGPFSNVITVKQNDNVVLDDKLLYELTFSNNQGRDISLYTNREFSRTQEGQFWAFDVKGVMTFVWNSGSLQLEYVKHENFTESLLEYWALHIVLPIFFTIEETFDFLHAGAVEVDNKPILFIAESYGGKSTMTDYFLKQRHMMISDDKVGTYEKDGQIFSISSHPHHRPYRKMEDLGYYVENLAFNSKPIHAIYELEKADSDSEIKIIELKGIEKFKSLRYASEMNIFFLKTKRFDYLVQMAKKVPVFKITVPWDKKRLEEVHGMICKHNKGM